MLAEQLKQCLLVLLNGVEGKEGAKEGDTCSLLADVEGGVIALTAVDRARQGGEGCRLVTQRRSGPWCLTEVTET